MGTMSQRTRVFVSTATAVVALFSVPGATFAADGGTIYFSGAIVAPQFIISATAGTRQVASARSTAAYDTSTATVAFDAPPGVMSGAHVGLQIHDGAASSTGEAALNKVTAHFVDNTGHTLTRTNGSYRLPQTGGSMTLAENTSGMPSANKPITVVVSYD